MKTYLTAIILPLLILCGCAVKTPEDAVGEQDKVIHENAQEHNSETVEKHETVIEENTEALEKKIEGIENENLTEDKQIEEPEEDFPYIRLNLDDTKPVTGMYHFSYGGKWA